MEGELMSRISDAMKGYRKLEDDLRRVRSQHALGSLHEDPILEEMAKIWWRLSERERDVLDREGPLRAAEH
jgi:hypothetical protein